MSEEEIIKNAKKFIEYLETDLDGNDENGIKWILYQRDLTTIQGLLDLYKKEKEKNKELELEIDKINEEKELYKFSGQNAFINVFINSNYISKDKIKEKIELIKSLNEKIYYEENVIDILNDLLEEK